MFTLDARLQNDTIMLGQFGLSRLLLSKDKRYPWCILVPQVDNIQEAYQLSEDQQAQLQQESNALGKTLMALFEGDSLNVAALGNVVSQLHVHHVVRYKNDPTWPGPIWGVGDAVSYSDQELLTMANKIKLKLHGTLDFIA